MVTAWLMANRGLTYQLKYRLPFGLRMDVPAIRRFWVYDLLFSTLALPIVMVVSQVLMQLYTPSPGVDPQQQKMMAFTMPAITGYFVWNYGSGLGLYWAVGNFIGIIQQMIMNRTSLGREMREIAVKRARRKTGAGKTPATITGKR